MPMRGGEVYRACFETDNDNDWYVFYTLQGSPTQLHIKVKMISCTASAHAYLSGKDASGYAAFSGNEEGSIDQTVPGPGPYYLQLQGPSPRECPPTSHYEIRVEPAARVFDSDRS